MQTLITVRQTANRGTENETSVERLVTNKIDQPYTRELFISAIAAAIQAAAQQDGPVTAIHAFVTGV